MAQFVEKLGNILKQYWTLPPELKNDPTTRHLMNQILEASGLPPASLGALTAGMVEAIPESSTKPIGELTREVMA